MINLENISNSLLSTRGIESISTVQGLLEVEDDSSENILEVNYKNGTTSYIRGNEKINEFINNILRAR